MRTTLHRHSGDQGRRPKVEDNTIMIKTCPRCGKTYAGHPAVSRVDNRTMICPDCGIREALASIDISEEEQERIIARVHEVSNP